MSSSVVYTRDTMGNLHLMPSYDLIHPSIHLDVSILWSSPHLSSILDMYARVWAVLLTSIYVYYMPPPIYRGYYSSNSRGNA